MIICYKPMQTDPFIEKALLYINHFVKNLKLSSRPDSGRPFSLRAPVPLLPGGDALSPGNVFKLIVAKRLPGPQCSGSKVFLSAVSSSVYREEATLVTSLT